VAATDDSFPLPVTVHRGFDETADGSRNFVLAGAVPGLATHEFATPEEPVDAWHQAGHNIGRKISHQNRAPSIGGGGQR